MTKRVGGNLHSLLCLVAVRSRSASWRRSFAPYTRAAVAGVPACGGTAAACGGRGRPPAPLGCTLGLGLPTLRALGYSAATDETARTKLRNYLGKPVVVITWF